VVGLPHVVAVGLEFESRLLPIFGQNFLVYLLKKWGDQHRIRTRVTSLRNNVVTTALLQVMSIEFISIFFYPQRVHRHKAAASSSPAPFSSLSPRRLLLFLTRPLLFSLALASPPHWHAHRQDPRRLVLDALCTGPSEALWSLWRGPSLRSWRGGLLLQDVPWFPSPTGAPPTGNTSSQLRPPLPRDPLRRPSCSWGQPALGSHRRREGEAGGEAGGDTELHWWELHGLLMHGELHRRELQRRDHSCRWSDLSWWGSDGL
jgi:hypothetical protein